ncbi:Metacaspase-1 [Bienertia sinuspersici]
MPLLVDCSNCKTPLQLPQGASSIRCAICHAITRIADHRTLPSSATPFYPPHHPPPSRASSALTHSYGPRAPPPPPMGGRKKAVIIGICYKNSRFELKGCINDARCMKYLLINRFKFPQDEILMLTEEERDPYRIPTRDNIRMAMAWLVAGCRAGDSLVFHYSGHGSQQRNLNGDEVDGYDETLCPLDFQTRGMIVDDEINDTLVKPLLPGVKLHAIIDACHSGTMLDLPFLCRMNDEFDSIWGRNERKKFEGRWWSPTGIRGMESQPAVKIDRRMWGYLGGGSVGAAREEWAVCVEDHRPRSGRWKVLVVERLLPSVAVMIIKHLLILRLYQSDFNRAMTYCFIQAVERGQAVLMGVFLMQCEQPSAIQAVLLWWRCCYISPYNAFNWRKWSWIETVLLGSNILAIYVLSSTQSML